MFNLSLMTLYTHTLKNLSSTHAQKGGGGAEVFLNLQAPLFRGFAISHHPKNFQVTNLSVGVWSPATANSTSNLISVFCLLRGFPSRFPTQI